MSGYDCTAARQRLEAYLDGELDAPGALALEQHLAACTTCRARLEQLRVLGAGLRVSAPYHRAPDALRARLKAMAGSNLPASAKRRHDWQRWSLPLAAGLVLAITLNLAWNAQRSDRALDEDVIAAHVRSLQLTHLTDVISTDQHTVRPWFNGKLDYAPPVQDLAADGFPLVGGRLDYLDHREVAALVYRRRQHVINVFVWPDARSGRSPPHSSEHDGYTLARWSDKGMRWFVVSDLNAAELREFCEHLRAAS
jgi:anti-sigma factor RsiW